MTTSMAPNRFFDRAPVALARVDRRGTIAAANQAFARLSGGRAAALRGTPLGAVVDAPGGGGLSASALAAAAGGQAFRARLRRADGTTLPVEVRAAEEGGAGKGYLVALTEAPSGAAGGAPGPHPGGTGDDLAGLIASGLAHHLNNYLATVVTNAALLAPRVAELPPDNGDFLAEITEASSNAAAMIRRLLAFSRDARLPVRALALGPHLTALTARLEHDLPADVVLECRDLLAAPGEVLTDAAAIDRIVAILVANAHEAMPEGGTVRVSCEEVVHERHDGAPSSEVPAGRYAVLTVADEGAGMDAEARARVFEPFFTTKGTRGHVGLGLPVVFGLVRRLGAHVTVESEPGVGTTVRVWLPADARATRRAGLTRASGPAPAVRGRRGGRPAVAAPRSPEGRHAILLVEDEVPLRVAAQKVLERLGYPVYSAGNGERGLRLFHAHEASVALVITDLMMPGLGGRGLFEALRAEGKQVPVVFTSGFVSAEMREREGLDPAVPFLEKPWEVPELVRVVTELAGPPPAPPS